MNVVIFLLCLAGGAAEARSDTSWKSVNLGWRKACAVDKGAISKVDDVYVFMKSKNRCSKGSIFKQRAELISNDIPVSQSETYSVRTNLSYVSRDVEAFIFLQVHDGRQGCSPPLSIRWKHDGSLGFDSDYTRGKGLSGCTRNYSLRGAFYNGPKLLRDGTEYEVNTVLGFDGRGGFHVEVFVDGKSVIAGRYQPPSEKQFLRSKRFHIKHGVYSANMWDFEMRSRNLRVYRAVGKAAQEQSPY